MQVKIGLAGLANVKNVETRTETNLDLLYEVCKNRGKID